MVIKISRQEITQGIVTARCPQGSALRNRQSVCDTLETAYFRVFYGICGMFYCL